MKKFFVASLLATVFMTCGLQLNAASWRVNNNTASGADFVDVNAAMNDERVAEGDTLYLDPGTYLTNTQYITRRVTIVGSGYLHQESTVGPAIFRGGLDIKDNAAGTKIEGCVFTAFNYINVSVDKVTFERNYFWGPRVFSSYSDYLVLHANYIETDYEAIWGSNVNTTGWVITNNIIKSGLHYDPATGGVAVRSLDNATIQNNVIINHDRDDCCIYDVWSSVITNNIIINALNATNGQISSPNNNNIITNNVTSSSSIDYEWPNFPNNTFLGSNDLTTVFETTGIADRYYRLCEGSPAKGAGVGGIDCGAYAGDSYVPSGLPLFYPYFTNAVIPAITTDGKLNIKLNIKTQNE